MIIHGATPGGKEIRLRCTTDGRLSIDTSASITATAAAPELAAATDVVWNDYIRTGTGGAIVLSAASATVRAALVCANENNSGNVTIGPNSDCNITLFPGQTYSIPAIPGGKFDLNDWYFNAGVGDTAHVIYVQ